MSIRYGDRFSPQVGQSKEILKIVISYLIFFILWQLLSSYTGEDLLPSPITTMEAVWTVLTSFSLLNHIFITLYRTIIGVVVSALVALLMVIAARYIGAFRYFFLKIVYPISRALPAVSFALLAIIWFGLGTASVVFVVFITVLPVYLIDLWEEMKVTDAPLLEMANSLTDRRFAVFRKVLLPLLVPKLFSSTKLNFSIALKLALVGELLAAQNGMGFKLFEALSNYRTDDLLAWTFLAMALIILFDYYVFDTAEERFLWRWIPND